MLYPFYNNALDNFFENRCNCCHSHWNGYNNYYRPQEFELISWNPWRDRVFNDIDLFRPSRTLVNLDNTFKRLQEHERACFNDEFFKKAHDENKDQRNFCQTVFKTTKLEDGKKVTKIEKSYRNSDGKKITEVTEIDKDGNKSVKVLEGDNENKMIVDEPANAQAKIEDGPVIEDVKETKNEEKGNEAQNEKRE